MAEQRRTCVGCRRTAPADELVRITRQADGGLAIGPGPGRGAWLCAPPAGLACLDAAARRRAFDHALRSTVEGDETVRLRARLEDMSG